MKLERDHLARVFAAMALSVMMVALSPGATSGQTSVKRPQAALKAKVLQVTNYVLQLPDAYIVYEPSRDVLQIAALGAVLSYGEGWERVQVRPYLFHLRHKAWKNHFWKINTSRKEAYLVWGGVFGRVGAKPGTGPALEVDGDREDITVEVVGQDHTQVPQRFLLRFAEAGLYFDPGAGDLRLVAAGMTLSPCDDWEACSLRDYLFHVRLRTWKGFHWKINTSRMAAWRTTGGEFCRLGGEDQELALTMKSFQRPFSVARLRPTVSASERSQLRAIAKMIEAGRPIVEINKAAADFVRKSPGLSVEAAVAEISKSIKGLESRAEETRNKRQEYQTMFENFDQKANQLFNILSTVMKNMKETQSGIVRNLL
jgi:hypothetical protein